MIETTETFQNLDRLDRILREYHRASGRTLAFAMVKTARELAFALRSETAKISPSAAKIRALPGNTPGNNPKKAKWGWAIGGGNHTKRQGPVMKEIERRIHSRLFHAVGWIPSRRGLARPGQVSTVTTKYGSIVGRVDDATGICTIRLENRTGRIGLLNAKHGLLSKAIRQVMLGMKPYIERKLGEAAAAAFSRI